MKKLSFALTLAALSWVPSASAEVFYAKKNISDWTVKTSYCTDSNEGILTDRNRIVLTAPGLSAPRKVRYWYAPPYQGAIYNEVNLPLGPFAAEVTEAEKRVR